MGLLEEARAESRPRTACKYADVRAALGEEGDELDEAVRDEDGVSLAGLSRALQRRGIEIAEETLRKHRTNKCRVCRESR